MTSKQVWGVIIDAQTVVGEAYEMFVSQFVPLPFFLSSLRGGDSRRGNPELATAAGFGRRAHC